jgi:UDP-N-acetylmuramoyl-tripeptide--D-alanyl-D-alanine ligase
MQRAEIFYRPRGIVSVHGRQLAQEEISLSFDSRTHRVGMGFLALKGENFDAFCFLESVLQRGAPVVIYESGHQVADFVRRFAHTTFIEVQDSLDYLQDLSHLHLLDWQERTGGKVVGITGSNGKTTTKEMLFHLLNQAFAGAVHKTQGNFNNHLGVPFTLLGLGLEHTVAVVEMGVNHPGELDLLCSLANPSSGIITNIGPAHLEFFKNEQGVFAEKIKLLTYVKGKGPFVIDADDPYLSTIEGFPGLITYGTQRGEVRLIYERGQVLLKTPLQEIGLKNCFLTGTHNYKNLASAFLLAQALFPQRQQEFLEAAESFLPTQNRSRWVVQGDKQIFLDAYNANPGSMMESLKGFMDELVVRSGQSDETLFLLGDMDELGDQSETFHMNMGRFLKQLGAQHVIFLGAHAQTYLQGFGGDAYTFCKKEELEKNWRKFLKRYRYFFLKGSRSLQLETLLDITR